MLNLSCYPASLLCYIAYTQVKSIIHNRLHTKIYVPIVTKPSCTLTMFSIFLCFFLPFFAKCVFPCIRERNIIFERNFEHVNNRKFSTCEQYSSSSLAPCGEASAQSSRPKLFKCIPFFSQTTVLQIYAFESPKILKYKISYGNIQIFH